jgi:hypothetical protein
MLITFGLDAVVCLYCWKGWRPAFCPTNSYTACLPAFCVLLLCTVAWVVGLRRAAHCLSWEVLHTCISSPTHDAFYASVEWGGSLVMVVSVYAATGANCLLGLPVCSCSTNIELTVWDVVQFTFLLFCLPCWRLPVLRACL